MKVKYSALVVQARGSLGDATFSTGRNGDYIRQRVDPAQPRTARQQAVRASFGALSAAWRSITDAQRAGWNQLATSTTITDVYGNTSRLTGQQLYVRTNRFRAELGLARSDAAPGAAPAITAVAITALAATPTTLTITTSPGTHPQAVEVFATGNFSAGRGFVADGQLRLIQIVAAGAAFPASIFTAYNAKFGAPATGSKIAVQLVPVHPEGFGGQPVRSVVTVGA